MRTRWEVIFDLATKEARLAELEEEVSAPEFWDDNERALSITKERSDLATQLERVSSLATSIDDLDVLLELTQEDESLEQELLKEIQSVDASLQSFEMERMLSGEHDSQDAILEINSGAGGTEAQDWGEMLMRMYLRWAERRGYKATVLDLNQGDKAGIKSATISIEGTNAFGFLRSERGVHRLVRISPFDQNARRHTSFASVTVTPDLDQDVEIEINDDEIRIDTYRASGAGGQHVNKTDSAVRITHLPSGIVVACQSLRSQHKNRDRALRVLKSKLHEIEFQKKRDEIDKMAGDKMKIDFGSQIRNYVMQPYQLVKDLRTDKETGNVQAVLDGEIGMFIQAYLLSEEHNIGS